MTENDDPIFIIPLRSRFGIGLEFFVKRMSEAESRKIPVPELYDILTQNSRLFFREESAIAFAATQSTHILRTNTLAQFTITDLLREKEIFSDNGPE